MMISLPEAFTERMKTLLAPSDFTAFLDSFSDPPARAVQLNTIKLSRMSGETEVLPLPFAAGTVPYYTAGRYVDPAYDGKLGNLPLHHAGAFYVQEPSAMAPVSSLVGRLKAAHGGKLRILDVCAAPGGKSAQAAAIAGEEAIVVSNEIVPSRCKVLVGNIERLGFRHSVVLNADSAYLKKEYPGAFDLVICDAPCSGEGMFRKSQEALDDWSEANVRACAERQKEILDNASACVGFGGEGTGYLLYSTCTYAPEENECVISGFLQNHPDFEVVHPGNVYDGISSPGVERYCIGFDPAAVRRFYPHQSGGEGQFFALLHRKAGGAEPNSARRNEKNGTRLRVPKKEEEAAICSFLIETIGNDDLPVAFSGDNLLILPGDVSVPEQHMFACGVKLGELRGKVLTPHHQFFSAYGDRFLNRIELDEESCRCYLHGEGFDCPGCNGWAVVTTNGVSLGGGKLVNGYLKNHYPKGLRIL